SGCSISRASLRGRRSGSRLITTHRKIASNSELAGGPSGTKQTPPSSRAKTPSGTTQWKWTFKLREPPKRCTKVTASDVGGGCYDRFVTEAALHADKSLDARLEAFRA